MNIIVTHDVDHLYNKDHFFRDLFFSKLIIRTNLQRLGLYGEKINTNEWLNRLLMPFRYRMNNIEELAIFDKDNNIPATFFFGMANCLSMNYSPNEALHYIKKLYNMGFSCGVHGCEYSDTKSILYERETFIDLTGRKPDGIRMHYVRFNSELPKKLSAAGYLFDSSKFNKKLGFCVEDPFKIGYLWEFPCCIMDSYLPYNLEKAKKVTLNTLDQAVKRKNDYFTVVFHDCYWDKSYIIYKKWFIWFIKYCQLNGFQFVSFKDAITSLNIRHYGY